VTSPKLIVPDAVARGIVPLHPSPKRR